jgi:RNA polymerase sigma factor (sigma-70 family)
VTRIALFTKHRGLAIGIAADYRVPGMEPDDVRQEALIGLWVASGQHDPAVGPFGAFARTVVTRRCVDLLREAGRKKRQVLTAASRDEALELVPGADVMDLILARERLREAVSAPEDFTETARRRRSWTASKRRQRAKA